MNYFGLFINADPVFVDSNPETFGFKYNMPDIAAAIGIHQLRKAEFFREKRKRVAQRYFEGLKGIPGAYSSKNPL